MALPGNITTITVTGTFLSPAGTAASGTVSFTPTSVLTDTNGVTILTEAPTTAQLSAGAFSVVLPCTNNVSIRPNPFEYVVNVNVPYTAQAAFGIALPTTLGSTVDLSALWPIPVPANPVNGIYVVSVNGQSGSAQVAPYNLSGTGAATRYVGGTTSGHPATGTFAAGDFSVDQSGAMWVCTSPGTPGAWTRVGS